MSVQITLSANAGVSLQFHSARIWIDALHDAVVPGFSSLSDEMLRQMQTTEAFQNPDAIIYTHGHPDHYSERLTRQASECWPTARLLMPEPGLPGAEILQGERVDIQVRDVHIHFAKLPHEGEQYRDVPHYGAILQEGNTTALIAGDCAMGSEELRAFISDKSIDVALLPFPWLTLRRGRDEVTDVIRPTRLLLYHIPFEEDDTHGYRKIIGEHLPLLRGVEHISCLDSFLQQESIVT